MATVYYGGSGTDPLIKIEITATKGGYSVKVTQVQATDGTEAALDPDQKFYIGDLRGFFIDFLSAESGVQVSSLKTYTNFDASGAGSSVPLVSGRNYASGSDNVVRVGREDNSMDGRLSGGDGYDLG